MIRIRNTSEADFNELLELFKEFSLFEKMAEKMENCFDRMVSEREFIHGFVAENEIGQIVGYVTYFYCYYTWVGKSMYIDDLFVKQNYRKNGIGTLLMRSVIDYAKESGCHKLRWQVSNWNQPAIDFYKKLGFEVVSEVFASKKTGAPYARMERRDWKWIKNI